MGDIPAIHVSELRGSHDSISTSLKLTVTLCLKLDDWKWKLPDLGIPIFRGANLLWQVLGRVIVFRLGFLVVFVLFFVVHFFV